VHAERSGGPQARNLLPCFAEGESRPLATQILLPRNALEAFWQVDSMTSAAKRHVRTFLASIGHWITAGHSRESPGFESVQTIRPCMAGEIGEALIT
jgi:hypothetical protein